MCHNFDPNVDYSIRPRMTRLLSLRTELKGNVRYKLLLDNSFYTVDNIFAEFFNDVFLRNGPYGAILLVQNRSRRTLDLNNKCFILVIEHAQDLHFKHENNNIRIESLENVNEEFLEHSASEIHCGVRSFINFR